MSKHEIQSKLTDYGFIYGAAEVEREFSNPSDGSVTISIKTPKTGKRNSMKIKITRTGYIRVQHNGKWTK